MSRDELMEFFNANIARYENFPKEVMEFINGEEDKLPSNLNKAVRYFDIDSFKEIKKELDGENSELAKRMLYLISKVQRSALCYHYSIDIDKIKLFLKIGYEFEEILEMTFYESKNYASSNVGYEIIKFMYEKAEEKVEYYASQLMVKDLEKFMNIGSVFKGDKVHEFYLQLVCVNVLLDEDYDKYKNYADILADYFKKASLNEQLIMILFRVYKHDDRLAAILKENILADHYVNEILYRKHGHSKKYLQFLKENNLKAYPYYCMIACHENKEGRNSILKELFINDKETFYDTYEFLKSYKQEAYNSLYLLAVMLKNNEGKELLEKDKKEFVNYAWALSRRASSKNNLFKLVLEDDKKTDDFFNEIIEKTNAFYIGPYNDMLKVFSLLSLYDEGCRKFIDYILSSKDLRKDAGMLSMAVDRVISTRNKWLDADIKKEMDDILYKYFEVEDIFRFLCVSRNNYRYTSNMFTHEFVSAYTKENEDKAVKFLNDECVKGDIDRTLIWLEQMYYYADIKDCSVLLNFINDKSKKIRNFCEKYISENEEKFRDKLLEIESKLKGEGLKLVKRIIKAWDNERKYGQDFTFKCNEQVIEFVNENYDEANEKLTKWINETCLENVRLRDSDDVVPSKVMRFILNEYMALTQVYRIKSCDKIIEKLNLNDVRDLLSAVYKSWVNDDNSDAKKKNIAVPYCIYSSDSSILAMKKQLEDWAKASRGAVAAYVVNAIALNGGKCALMLVESISEKFPNSMVEKSARNAFRYAARVLEIPEDVLCDKIIPDLGFDKFGEKIIDYGSRTFKATLMEDFTLTIFDNEKNKAVKSLPKPNDKDDKFKAEAARKEFTALKKQIKSVVNNQTERLEHVFINGRTWSAEGWKELFIENPIMQMFARKLIWGVYDEKGSLVQSFRYMEDGTFTTDDEDEYEYEIEDNAQISLVHPCELDEETREKWMTQLDDYEIVQPFEQINMKFAVLKKEEIKEKIVKRYAERKTTSGALIKMFNKYNLLRGEIYDGGGFACYHYIDKYLNMGVKIEFDDMYVGISQFDEEVSLRDVVFYRIDEEFNDEPNDDINDESVLNPEDIPQRFVTGLISIFDSLLLKED